jgi:hypothetical protein
MTNKVKRSIRTAAESDYEIHRLAKKRGITVTAARERCYHFAAVHFAKISPEDLPMKTAADLRQAEAKVEMLKASAS